jgi:large subunit ribosomal protein L30
MIGIVLVRGTIGTRPEVRETLKRLNLTRKNSVVFVEDTPQTRGMIHIVKDYVTFGAVSDETVKAVIEARAETPAMRASRVPGREARPASGRQGTVLGSTVKLPIRLSPPRKGFERGGIKKPFSQGGALAERTNMDELLMRMV